MGLRTFGVFALVLVAGCSLVWDMDPYEGGANARDGGGADGGGTSTSSGTSGAASSGTTSSSGTTTSSSGGSSGIDIGDAAPLEGGPSGADAGVDSGTCSPEPDPNDVASDAEEVPPGKTCGTISAVNDSDWYLVTVPSGALTITIELGVNVQVFVYYEAGGGGYSQTPGTKTVTLPSGENMIRFASFGGQSGGGYTIRRP